MLTLAVARFAGAAPPQTLLANFDEQGGSISRLEGNDWVLPDPERFVSGRHALISFSDGRFHVTDLSSNGVFLNGLDTPLGKQNRAPLQQGDILNIGEYEITVSLQRPVMEPADADHFDALDDPLARLVDENAGVALARNFPTADSGDQVPEQATRFSLDEADSLALEMKTPPLQTPPPVTANESDHVSDLNTYFSQPTLIPEDWEEEKPSRNEVAPQGPTDPPASPYLSLETNHPLGISGKTESTPPHQIPDSAPAAPRPMAGEQPAPPLATADQQALREALARGLGISRNTIDEIPLPALLENLGQIVRCSVEGTMSVLRARAQMKSEFRMSQTMIRPVENNALKFSVNTEEALRHIIDPRPGSGYLSPLASFREAHEDTEAHMLAVMVGMQSALKAVLMRFKPESLEQRLGQSSLLEKLPIYRQAKTWELFNKLYDEIANEAEDDFQQLFGRSFSQAYEAQIRRLTALKNSNGALTTNDRN